MPPTKSRTALLSVIGKICRLHIFWKITFNVFLLFCIDKKILSWCFIKFSIENYTYISIDTIENSYLGNGIQMIILQLVVFKIDAMGQNLLTLFSNILTDDFCETKKRDDF